MRTVDVPHDPRVARRHVDRRGTRAVPSMLYPGLRAVAAPGLPPCSIAAVCPRALLRCLLSHVAAGGAQAHCAHVCCRRRMRAA